MIDIARQPDALHVELDTGWVRAVHDSNGCWDVSAARCYVRPTDPQESSILLETQDVGVKRIHLRFRGSFKGGEKIRVLGDHWERGYGDLGWQGIVPERVMPWYAMVRDGDATIGYGVKTGAAALCSWRLDNQGISLVLDVRAGNQGVVLGNRILQVATIVMLRGQETESAFETTQRFCSVMCASPLLPSQPVYGGNNWYYAYGNSSHGDILDDSKRIAEWAPAMENRPFMVIDDGWQLSSQGGGCNGGPWIGNSKFPDMERLAENMKLTGVRPGIWIRPLLTMERVPEHWIRASQNGAFVLDPSVPAVLDYVRQDIEKLSSWGYELIKHDFTTYDIFGLWGFEMGSEVPGPNGFRNSSKTTAEIVYELYQVIADASKESLLIGCNTIGHLGAGLFEIQRTGDDTSGREWERTRKMGINTLAFRMPQHGTFFSADADCVGLTEKIPWRLNEMWLELLALSGTPLFISADPKAVGPVQEKAIRHAFELASKPLPPGEPLDWMESTCPSIWKLNNLETRFQWFGDHGVIPAYD